MPRLLIIADDLTGAMDTGAQLAKQSVGTVVLPDVEGLERCGHCEAAVVNTETRHATPEAAAEAVTSAVRMGRSLGVTHFYKKTDSTLRGNVGIELQAVLSASGARRLVFVPAFPRLGRTTVAGKQYVNRVELHETEYARDPLNPIHTSVVAERVREQTDCEIHSVSVSQLARVDGEHAQGIYVVDCSSDDDLHEIAAVVRNLGWTQALAGSAGFAECLAGLLGMEHESASGDAIHLPDRMLVVNGSLNPGAVRQVARAEACGWPVMRVDARDPKQSQDVIAAVARQSAAVVVISPTVPRRVEGEGGPSQDALLSFAEELGRLAAKLIDQSKFRSVVVIGGDTLAALARAMGCRALIVLAELLPGVALSKIARAGEEIFVISKAGGFGGDDVLPHLYEEIRRLHR